jgi:hypothetical protein
MTDDTVATRGSLVVAMKAGDTMRFVERSNCGLMHK